jgi:hypothetical protein
MQERVDVTNIPPMHSECAEQAKVVPLEGAAQGSLRQISQLMRDVEMGTVSR